MKTAKYDNTGFRIIHEFDAPKKLVFEAFSDADALNEWWGPVNSKNVVIKLDFTEGGIFHYRMESQESQGKISYGRFLFAKIRPHHLLEFSNAFADEHANVIPAPFGIPLPLEIYYRLEFSERGGKTTITLTGRPVNATDTEWAAFKSIEGSMQEGFGATFKKLAAYLHKFQIKKYHG